MKRAFDVDVLVCPHCGGGRRLISLITDPAIIRRILAHLKLPQHSYKLVKNGKTWFNNWQDWYEWVEPETPEEREAAADKLKEDEAELARVVEDIARFEDRIKWRSTGWEEAKKVLPRAQAKKIRLEEQLGLT